MTELTQDDFSKDLAGLSQNIDDTIKRIESDAIVKEGRSSRQRAWDIFLRATTAVLAVASPALVTYSTTSSNELYKLAAILLTGIAGASATLQAIFGLQQTYVRNAIDALDLHNLKAQLETAKQEALRKGQSHEKYADLKLALSNTTKNYRDIIIGRQKAYLERIAQ